MPMVAVGSMAVACLDGLWLRELSVIQLCCLYGSVIQYILCNMYHCDKTAQYNTVSRY